MSINECAFFGSEKSRLLENSVGYANLSNVVEQRRDLNLIHPLFRNLHLAGYAKGPLRQSGAVHAGVDVFQVQHLVKRADQRITKCEMLLLQFLHSEEQTRHILIRIYGCQHSVRTHLYFNSLDALTAADGKI